MNGEGGRQSGICHPRRSARDLLTRDRAPLQARPDLTPWPPLHEWRGGTPIRDLSSQAFSEGSSHPGSSAFASPSRPHPLAPSPCLERGNAWNGVIPSVQRGIFSPGIERLCKPVPTSPPGPLSMPGEGERMERCHPERSARDLLTRDRAPLQARPDLTPWPPLHAWRGGTHGTVSSRAFSEGSSHPGSSAFASPSRPHPLAPSP